jgi:hypothetical protein
MRSNAEDVHLEGLRRFVQKVADLSPLAVDRVRGLQTYVDRSVGLVRADARRRYDEATAHVSTAFLETDMPPSLLSLGQIEVTDETRHSLLLASLLDPGRTGPLAEWTWPRLLKLARSRLEEVHDRGGLRAALDAWDPSLLERTEVMPTEHRSELDHLDVFARVDQDGDYVFGLVIENKVQASTAEQDDQLLRYWRDIGDKLDPTHDRTVFIFLTEGPRTMKSAGESKPWWVHLEWTDIADLLLDASNDPDVPFGYRLLAAHHRDLIDTQILGRTSPGETRARIRRLRHDLAGADPDDRRWSEHHPEIIRLWKRQRFGGST